MKNRLLGIALLLCLTSFAAVAGDDAAALVTIKDFKFVPQHITIKVGQTITWENREKRQYHSVWFEAQGEAEPEDYLFSEDTYERTFDKSGTFPYRCGPHPEMTGTVTVTE
ncbi:MAG: cupredoxin domain-containing protein [Gammaproteobacteria bacterium]|nr:cupredoxin domain-containing protein [Gammaproteobacteria bacterium]